MQDNMELMETLMMKKLTLIMDVNKAYSLQLKSKNFDVNYGKLLP